ncbi:MAG: GNAT family N-acetyltransferase [Ruminococcaceae bacterium]|nr:GNAT family N-acetyltransferase [Oscillospiraceae bacterium]
MTQEKLHHIFTNPPIFETERLILRKINISDADEMFAYSSNEAVTRYLLWDTHPDPLYTEYYIRYLQERYAVGDFYDFAVVPKETGRMIGTVGFTSFDLPNRSAEIGYVISPVYQNKGYATEAVMKILAFGFEECNLERISAVCMKGNLASLRVMEKCGLKREGLLRSAVFAKGEMKDVHLSAITRKDYFSKAYI